MDGASLATPACSSTIQANAAARDRHVKTPVIADTVANVDGVMMDDELVVASLRGSSWVFVRRREPS